MLKDIVKMEKKKKSKDLQERKNPSKKGKYIIRTEVKPLK